MSILSEQRKGIRPFSLYRYDKTANAQVSVELSDEDVAKITKGNRRHITAFIDLRELLKDLQVLYPELEITFTPRKARPKE